MMETGVYRQAQEKSLEPVIESHQNCQAVESIMVLQNCRACAVYWLKNGRNMYGYQLLSRDQHIPEAHVKSSRPVAGKRISPQPGFNSCIRRIHNVGCEKPNSSQPRFQVSRTSSSKHNVDGTVTHKKKSDDDEDYTAGEPYLDGELCCDDDDESDIDMGFCLFDDGDGECLRDKVEEPIDEPKMEMMEMDTSWYFPLYKAAMDGDWETAEQLYNHHGEIVLRSKIRGHSETALHVAIGSGQGTIFFIREMVQHLTNEDLEEKSRDGCTSLGIAAKVGNVEAALLLVAKHPKLLYIADNYDSYPIHNAAEYGQKEMLLYLLQVTKNGQNPDPYDPEGCGPKLLHLMIRAEFYDAALLLLNRMPKLATSGMDSNLGLIILAKNPYAFSCWRNEGVFFPLIYTCVPKLQGNQSYLCMARTHDVENAACKEYISEKAHFYCKRYLISGLQKIHHLIWMFFERIVPLLKYIKHQKLKGYDAKKLVKYLCKFAAQNLKKSSDAALLFKFPLLQAAENGIYEIVKEITYSFPDAIWYTDDSNSEVFRLAIQNRHHEVYNLLHEMGDLYINIVRQSEDEYGDNILHLAGTLAPSDRLRVVSGAALQMQRELQWFKEIESLVQPEYKSKRNTKGKTPQEVFSECHQKLMEEGERWMRDTANSCTVVATLIATIVFAAAITVPGGNSGDNGKPMFGSEKAFIIFGVADALSLFTSCVSILMFLSILTSRYAEGDFHRALPTKLIVGLLTLFMSVASMMVAFSSTLYLMFGDKRRWILGCIIGPACLIVAVFASMQFSLLAEMINSTYRSTIFKRRCKNKSPMSCINERGLFKKVG